MNGRDSLIADGPRRHKQTLLLGVPLRADSRVPRGYIVYVANGHVWLIKVPT